MYNAVAKNAKCTLSVRVKLMGEINGGVSKLFLWKKHLSKVVPLCIIADPTMSPSKGGLWRG